jgi:hypothetical protein
MVGQLVPLHHGRLQDGLEGLQESLGCKWSRNDAIHAIQEVYQMLFDQDAAAAARASTGPNPELRESYAAALLAMGRVGYHFSLALFCVGQNINSVDDSQYGPCDQSDTPRE